jgi:WbqC-like protein family
MKLEETLSVMQPYAFPYFGYFCLIQSSNEIVFYDDVNFIKGGWINRNRILVNNEPTIFNVFLSGASSFKEIREIKLLNDDKKTLSTLKTIQQSYKNAPFFQRAYPHIERVFLEQKGNVADFAIASIQAVYDYIGLQFKYRKSSEDFSHTKGEDKVDRLVHMCEELGYKNYINVMGGQELYTKEVFAERGINLYFNKPSLTPYDQFGDSDFHPYLSIIDVMMFCSPGQIRKMLFKYEII